MTQNTSPPWPQLVHDAITNLFGKPIRFQSLGGGQSHANVWRVQFPARSVIVIRTKQPRERLFYTTIAPLLQERKINALIQQFPEWLDRLLLDGI